MSAKDNALGRHNGGVENIMQTQVKSRKRATSRRQVLHDTFNREGLFVVLLDPAMPGACVVTL